MTPQRLQRIVQTLNLRQPDLTVVTDEVKKEHNLSAIVRSCDAFAIPEVHCVWAGEKYHVRRNQAAGAGSWVDVKTHDTIADAITNLQGQGFKVCAAHFTDRAINYRDYDFTQPTAVLLGTEKEGVSDVAAEMCDEHLIIPMHGMTNSFNVSVACALILSEAQRQRELAGMYEQRRLPDAEYERLYFEWCQPQITRICKQHNLPYPPLRDDGELLDPQAFSELVNNPV
ncbi:tRNA (guanosine(18)-2'-O)-methyltransferase TrmH [Thalassolituus marinus]|uniref:tRNA (guanosine(18)-2'-O)-methyltransferase n=1 Tax=Thalassolituus marinus TaxID=671053 RepID=A0ABS7ZKK9_9GAMM|nr:tRNA (guanosine(18)-2'-O)-methyltransferase TrmH [Thalassolituus marinus]MCA6062109.1 tRNA (guanosine(18)-2'-O)-methyltransferase TrmH [Thalassolituus marinus]